MKCCKPLVLVMVIPVLFTIGGCSGKKKLKNRPAQYVSTEVMFQRGLDAMENRDLRKARQIFERIEFTAENRSSQEPLVRLALADATFYALDDLSLIDARSLYLDFVTLYGDHPKAPYAQLQAGVCSLKQVNHPSRDQAQTLEAIRDLREVTRRYPDSAYARIAREMIRRGQNNLAEHELIVARFYLKKKQYQASITRLREVLQKYPDSSCKDQVFFYLGKSLVLGGNDIEGRIYLDKLLEDYPGTEFAEEANKLLAARGDKTEPGGQDQSQGNRS
jgi:outer membrane protein assembly factor BamD